MVRLSRKLTWGLALVGCLGVTSLYGARLWAQTRPPGPTTVDEAAKEFLSCLVNPEAARYLLAGQAPLDMVAQKNFDTLGKDGVTALFNELYREYLMAGWHTTIHTDDNGAQATVGFAPPQTVPNTPKPVVCVRDGDSWRVDLIATYACWNDLDAPQSLVRIAAVTGVLIPGVPINAKNSSSATAFCQNNLKQISLDLAQYAQDNDEKYPPANKWCDALHPYVQDEKIYHCPALPQNKYGYAMNWKFSCKKLTVAQSATTTVNFYESKVLRRNGNGDGRDLDFRHGVEDSDDRGANYAYADGHIKWVKQGIAQKFRLALPASK